MIININKIVAFDPTWYTIKVLVNRLKHKIELYDDYTII
jgi:hypothetical protein